MLKIIFLIGILLLVFKLFYTKKRYYSLLPTINMYPNNYEEVKILKNEYVDTRTLDDEEFFFLTEDSVPIAFISYVDEDINELNKIAISPMVIIPIMLLKLFFNRARPWQIDNNLNVLSKTTANTPAYPSGHALQAYYLAKKLAEKYPHKKEILNEVAEKVAIARLHGGVHYPSDKEFAKKVVDKLF